jgi:hypothetical protein
MSDTKTQLRNYWEHLDHSHGRLSLDEVLPKASELEPVNGIRSRSKKGRIWRGPRWVRPVVVFGGAFVAVAVAVGVHPSQRKHRRRRLPPSTFPRR